MQSPKEKQTDQQSIDIFDRLDSTSPVQAVAIPHHPIFDRLTIGNWPSAVPDENMMTTYHQLMMNKIGKSLSLQDPPKFKISISKNKDGTYLWEPQYEPF